MQLKKKNKCMLHYYNNMVEFNMVFDSYRNKMLLYIFSFLLECLKVLLVTPNM